METFTYLKSGCLYALQYSFFEVFLLLLLKKQPQKKNQTPQTTQNINQIVNIITKKAIPNIHTQKKLFGHTLYLSESPEGETQQNTDIANGHNAILKSDSPLNKG